MRHAGTAAMAAAGSSLRASERVEKEAADHKERRGNNHKNFRRVIASKNAEHWGTLTVPDTRAKYASLIATRK
jgi:hypothetical protein